MGGPILEVSGAANEFVGKTLLGQVAPPQQGPQPFQPIVDNFFRVNPALLSQVTGGMAALPANATPQQQEAAALQLYQRLVAGGPGGLRYSYSGNRLPRTPNEVLTANPRGGDCDELTMLFIAAARQLNINTSGMSMAYISIPTMKPGTTREARHATLFVRNMNGSNYIMDFSIGSGPFRVPDFNPSTISREYKGLNIANGPGAGHAIISATMLHEFGALRDIAAFALMDRVDVMVDAFGTGNASATQLNAALRVLGQASTAAASDSLRVMVADRYRAIGERALSSGHPKIALGAFTAGTAVLGSVPLAVRNAQAQRSLEYQIGVGIAGALERSGSSSQAGALAQYERMVRLDPTRLEAYEGIYRIRLARFNAAHPNNRPAAQAEVDALVPMMRSGVASSGTDVIMSTDLGQKRDTIVNGATARGYTIPP